MRRGKKGAGCCKSGWLTKPDHSAQNPLAGVIELKCGLFRNKFVCGSTPLRNQNSKHQIENRSILPTRYPKSCEECATLTRHENESRP